MITAEGVERQPHANKNMPLRALKARKIEALLGLDSVHAAGQLLEVGTGSGGIAHYFACHAHVSWQVSAVDVVDNRQVMEGYEFLLASGCKLPFPAASFDVVISNHVIEHVGDAYSQLSHLEELRRVLKPEGRGYLAVPNRWMVVEPHYRLPFLSWLPRAWRTPYLRISGKGMAYDCEPLQLRQLERLLGDARLRFRNLGTDAIQAMARLERSDSLVWIVLRLIPPVAWRISRNIMPTLIYEIRP